MRNFFNVLPKTSLNNARLQLSCFIFFLIFRKYSLPKEQQNNASISSIAIPSISLGEKVFLESEHHLTNDVMAEISNIC